MRERAVDRALLDEPNLAALERKIDRPVRDFMKEKPVPDAVFAQYLRQFDYDKTPLHAKIEEEKEIVAGKLLEAGGVIRGFELAIDGLFESC